MNQSREAAPKRVAARARSGMARAWALAGGLVLAVLAGSAGPGRAAVDTVWLQVRAETDAAAGRQVSRFRAFTTRDQAGTEQVPVPRLCVKGRGHEVHERCEKNAASVEVVERVPLNGAPSRCVAAEASAESPVGALSAASTACP